MAQATAEEKSKGDAPTNATSTNVNDATANDTNNDNKNDENSSLTSDQIIRYDKSTSLLTWDEIAFLNKEEKEGAMKLQDILKTQHGIVDAAPFEMARYFIGSKCRIEKATQKYLDTMKFCQKYKFNEITNDQLTKCLAELCKSMSIGGKNKDNSGIFGVKYSFFFPNNYESSNILFKAFLLLMNYLSQDLDIARNGITFVADMKNFGWQNFSIDIETMGVELLQNVYPLRLKAMYMVDSPKIIEIIMKIMKPLMSKKMRDRMFIVDKNTFINQVNLQQCPVIVGGKFTYQTITEKNQNNNTNNNNNNNNNNETKESKDNNNNNDKNDTNTNTKDNNDKNDKNDRNEEASEMNNFEKESEMFYQKMLEYHTQMANIHFDKKENKWIKSESNDEK